MYITVSQGLLLRGSSPSSAYIPCYMSNCHCKWNKLAYGNKVRTEVIETPSLYAVICDDDTLYSTVQTADSSSVSVRTHQCELEWLLYVETSAMV